MVGSFVSHRTPWRRRIPGAACHLLILTSLLVASVESRAQSGAWTRKADLVPPRGGASASALDGRIYAVGGYDAWWAGISTNQVFDPSTGSWEARTLMGKGRAWPTTAVLNGILYAIGGEEPPVSTRVEAYDPVADRWTRKADMPGPRMGAQAAVVGGVIYAMGGDYTSARCEAYDPLSDSWTSLTERPESGGMFSVTAFDDIIYTFGGSDAGDRPFATVLAYDPKTDTWTKKADMPTARYAFRSFLVEGKIYALGGSQSEGKALATVEVYDPRRDEWTTKPGMPMKSAFYAGSVVNGKIYIIGGTPDWVTGGYEVWEYDPSFRTDIVGGAVQGNWTRAQSPYFVHGEVTVPDGETLTIDPGVEVIFTGHHKLNVQGRLLAIGTTVDSIWFTAQNPDTGWHGIRFINTPETNDTSKLIYCSFRHGKANTGDPGGLDRCGGAIMVYRFDRVLISHCLFEHNSTEGDVGSTGGPGICVFYGSPVITMSTFRNNTGTSAGAIKIDYASTALVSGNVITNNSMGSGAILCAYGSDNRPTISGNLIADNTAVVGAGGILVWQSAPRIENNVIVGNRAPRGGGLYVSEGRPAIVNNTIALNSATGSGGGLYCVSNAVPVLVNNILFGNRADAGAQVFVEDRTCSLFVRGCDIQGGLAGLEGPGAGAPFAGVYEGNIDLDPRFADTSSGDYRLTDHSGCIGSGVDSAELGGIRVRAPAGDIDGSPRPDPPGSRPDIGAWEHRLPLPMSLLTLSPLRHDFQNVRPGSGSDTLAILIQNRGAAAREIASVSLRRSEFQIAPMPILPLPLPSLAEVSLCVVFRPRAPGVVVADTLVVCTSDTLALRVPIVLTGRGSDTVRAARPGVLYGLAGGAGAVRLYWLERASGKASLASTFSPRPPPGLSAVTIRPADQTLCAAFSAGAGTELFRLSSECGDLEPFAGISVGHVTAMAFDDQDRVFLATADGHLYRSAPPGFAPVLTAVTGHAFTGLAFSPATGALWASIHDTLCTIDTATGNVTMVGWSNLAVGRSTITFSDLGVLYGLYDNSLVMIERVGGGARLIGTTDVAGLGSIAMRCDVASELTEGVDPPLAWRLDQNYPNPFNSTTIIRYELPEGADARLAVFDCLGREVAILVGERKAPGTHAVEFSAPGLASGVYFYRLTAGIGVKTRKMVVLK